MPAVSAGAPRRHRAFRWLGGAAAVLTLLVAAGVASDTTRPDSPQTLAGRVGMFLVVCSLPALLYAVAGCIVPVLPGVRTRRRAGLGLAACVITMITSAALIDNALTPAQRQARETARAEAAARRRAPTHDAEADAVDTPERGPSSEDSYAVVATAVGCPSTYSSDKKNDTFRQKYRDHWMTWRGDIMQASAGAVDLNLDDVGLQDLHVSFADAHAGYELRTGDRITVRFLMKTAGGCLLPFLGEEARILK